MSAIEMLRQLEPDTRLVRPDERKKPLCYRLRGFVIRVVAPIEAPETLFVIPGHSSVDCIGCQVCCAKRSYGLPSDCRGLLATDALQSSDDSRSKLP
jgi:hypothetical protein